MPSPAHHALIGTVPDRRRPPVRHPARARGGRVGLLRERPPCGVHRTPAECARRFSSGWACVRPQGWRAVRGTDWHPDINGWLRSVSCRRTVNPCDHVRAVPAVDRQHADRRVIHVRMSVRRDGECTFRPARGGIPGDRHPHLPVRRGVAECMRGRRQPGLSHNKVQPGRGRRSSAAGCDVAECAVIVRG